MADRRRPSSEDAALWEAVAASVQPLRRRRRTSAPVDLRPDAGPAGSDGRAESRRAARDDPAKQTGKHSAPHPPPLYGLPPRVAKNSAVPALSHGAAPGVDKRTAARLRRGQLAVDARLDLHGRTQTSAHEALIAFVEASQAAGRRAVLIITGKGQGVLKEAVPRWLNAPPLRQRVLAFSYAQPKHGGEGALYVYLRKVRSNITIEN